MAKLEKLCSILIQLTSTKNSMKSYNCLENVSNILVSSEQIFHETLLVTWEEITFQNHLLTVMY